MAELVLKCSCGARLEGSADIPGLEEAVRRFWSKEHASCQKGES